MLARLRIGHTRLNNCLSLIVKNLNGLFIHCGEVESILEKERAMRNRLSLKNILSLPGKICN